jgi:hypothetical protein
MQAESKAMAHVSTKHSLHLVHATQVNADHVPTASCNAYLVIVLAILVIAILQAGAQEIVVQSTSSSATPGMLPNCKVLMGNWLRTGK